MAKIELKGYAVDFTEPKEMGENKTMIQSLILKVPAYIDEFGDKKGKDEFWQIQIIGEELIAKLNLNKIDTIPKKVIVACYINSNYIPSNGTRTKDMYIINAVLKELKIIQ